MARKPKASSVKQSAKPAAGKPAPAPVAAKKEKLLKPDHIIPVRHTVSDPDNDPEAEPKPVKSVAGLDRPYFKGLPILKAYHGRTLKYFVKMGDGITCFLFQPGGDEEHMFKTLMSQPRVSYQIPLDPGERRGQAVQHIQLNNLRMNIIKGRVVKLPENVAFELGNAQEAKESATSSVQVTNPETGELVNPNLAYRDDVELRALTK